MHGMLMLKMLALFGIRELLATCSLGRLEPPQKDENLFYTT